MRPSMRFLPQTAGLVLVICAVIFQATSSAQISRRARGSEAPGVPKTDQQKSGEALFTQNCTLCHTRDDSRAQKALGIWAPTELIGLFKIPSVTEEKVRSFIMEGEQGKMLAFKYIFEPKELDDLIAYLKIR